MKQPFLLMLAIAGFNSMNAQNTFPATGHVGIGTNSPTQPLDVRGQIYTTGSVVIDGGDLLLNRTSQAFGYVARPNIAGYKKLQFAVAGGGPLEDLYVHADNSFITGKVGIGISNPEIKLQVQEGHVASVIGNYGFVELWNDNAIIWKRDNSNQGLRFGSAANLNGGEWSEKMRLMDNGNLGLGIVQPTAKLEIVNAGSSTLRVGITSNRANTYSQFLNSVAAIGNNNTTGSTIGAVAWDFFNDGNNPTWAGTILQHHATGESGNYLGFPAANQGTLVFQNTTHAVIASNGADIQISPLGNPTASFRTDGKVGIGTTNPWERLHVNGNVRIESSSDNGNIGGSLFLINPGKTANNAASKWAIYNMAGIYGNSLQFWAYDNAGCGSGGLCNNRFTIMDNGNVGIGTSTPGSFRLAVEGTIGARKVKVTQTNPWPDYVFEKEYQLPSLRDVEEFINKNKHLPEVPSAKEVEKNGLDLGDNQAVLLKKIEEMTLYIIQQNKTMEAMQKRIEALENKM